MHNTAQIIKLIVLAIIAIALLTVIALGLLHFISSSSDAATDARYEVYERFSNRYYESLFSYKGVCYDMKPSPQTTCQDSDETFRVYERLEDGFYNCTDANGYQGRLQTIPAGTLWCR